MSRPWFDNPSISVPLVLAIVAYFVDVLWWEPRQKEKMRREQKARTMAALDAYLAKHRGGPTGRRDR